jgi:hypothetical protein
VVAVYGAVALAAAGLFLCGFALSAAGAPAASSAASLTYCAPQQPNVLKPVVFDPEKMLIYVCDQERITAIDVVEVSSRTPIARGDYANSVCLQCGDCKPDPSFFRELHCTELVLPPLSRGEVFVFDSPHVGDLIEITLHFEDGTTSTADLTVGPNQNPPWAATSTSTESTTRVNTTGQTGSTSVAKQTTTVHTPTTAGKTTPTTPTTTETVTTTKYKYKPCKCKSLTLKIDGNLFTKAQLRPDQQDFGIGFNWIMVCTGGNGVCTGTVRFSPPTILAGTLPKPTGVLRLNLKKMVFACVAPCGAATVGSFKAQMLKRDQLNVLFGRTVAFTIRQSCSGVSTVTRIKVLVERNGRLKLV